MTKNISLMEPAWADWWMRECAKRGPIPHPQEAFYAAWILRDAEVINLKEQIAALESREVCAAAHNNVETCGYCQRDVLQTEIDDMQAIAQRIVNARLIDDWNAIDEAVDDLLPPECKHEWEVTDEGGGGSEFQPPDPATRQCCLCGLRESARQQSES